jgi:hypothetical protein
MAKPPVPKPSTMTMSATGVPDSADPTRPQVWGRSMASRTALSAVASATAAGPNISAPSVAPAIRMRFMLVSPFRAS